MAEGTNIGNINEIAAAIGKSVADNMAAAAGNAEVLGIEREREASKERAEFKHILQGIHKALTGSFATFKDRDQKSGGMLAGLLGGVSGTSISSLGKGIASLGKGLAVGLGALGAGIAAFFIGIGTADFLAKWSGADGEALTGLIKNFFGAFDIKAAVMMGGIIAAAVGITKMGKFAPLQLMAGMTAIAAGLGGFFTGILLGDFVTKHMSDALEVDGTGLASLMNNFFGSFTAVSGAMVVGLVGIAAAMIKFGSSAKDPLKLMAGMTAIGAGLGGFFIGVLLSDKFVGKMKEALEVDGTALGTLMGNFLGAFKTVESVGALFAILIAGAAAGMGKVNPLSIVAGMTAIGAGLVGFFGGLIIAEKGAEFVMGDVMAMNPGENIAKLMQSFLSSFKGVGVEGITALGLILAAGAIIGLKKGISGGLSVAIGMTGIGAGLAGFFGGLALGEAALEGVKDWTGKAIDGKTLSKFMKNFMGTFDGVSDKGLIVMGALLAAGATMGALLSPASLLKVPLGMTALGAGIAGFFGGLSLAESLMEKVSDWTGAKVSDGATLSTFMQNFAKALDGMSDKSLKILGGMLVAGAAIGVALPGVGPLGVALGMTALGAGLAGFFAGLSMADFVASKAGTGENLKQLMTNLGEGIGGFIGGIAGGAMKGFLELDADKLSQVGAGVKDLGMGMLAFAGGTAGGAVAGVMEGIAGFFGADSPLEKIEDFVDEFSDKDAKRLTTIGKGMLDLGMGFAALGGVDATKVNANLASMQGLDLEQLMAKANTKGNEHDGGLIKRSGNYNLMAGEAVMTPAQLTNMANTMELLVGSRNIEAGKNGGAPIVVNNIDQSQQTQTNMNRTQNVNVGSDSPHNQNSTLSRLN